MSRHRICFPFVGDSVGGSALSSLMLIQSLDTQRYEPLIVVHSKGPLTAHLRKQNISYTALPLDTFAGAVPSLRAIMTAAWKARRPLTRYLRDHEIAIVHANDLRMNLTWALPARLTGTRMIWHQRTLVSGSVFWRLLPYLTDAVLAISQAVVDSLGAMKRPVQLVYNPFETNNVTVDRTVARSNLCQLIGAPDDSYLVGYVGRLYSEKRPDFCIEIMPHLQSGLPKPVHLVFLGADNWGFSEILQRRVSELNLQDRIHFLGFRYPVEDYIAGMDLLIAPTVNEAFGRSVVEAMLLGTPVIASRAGGHQEIIDDGITGILAPPYDAPSFARLAVDILRDDQRSKRMAAAAKSEAKKRYSLETHVSKIEATYEALTS
jgi:glycosyltransferase involved in cell wall biosynthesis